MGNLTASIAAALALLAGGALSAAPPPSGGTIAVELDNSGTHDPSSHTFVDAAAAALAAKGFTLLEDPGHAAYAAELILTRADIGTARAKVPTGGAAILPGASAGVGAGVAIPFSAGKSSLVPLQRTLLELRIRRRGEQGVAWHGAAVTIRPSGTRQGADERVAADLSEAVLRSYPAEPVDVVGVP